MVFDYISLGSIGVLVSAPDLSLANWNIIPCVAQLCDKVVDPFVGPSQRVVKHVALILV